MGMLARLGSGAGRYYEQEARVTDKAGAGRRESSRPYTKRARRQEATTHSHTLTHTYLAQNTMPELYHTHIAT